MRCLSHFGEAWPIGYDDVAPWYSHVERFIGVCGSSEGLDVMPDGGFLPPYEMNAVEAHLQKVIKDKFGRHYLPGRWAHLTEAKDIHLDQARGQCQNRDKCMRGCPFGAYFSSNASTLPWAERTGNLTVRPDSVVHSIVYDEGIGRASGVHVIDAKSRATMTYGAKVIFVNASALNSNLILLNSKSERFPNGLGNDSGILGTHICFHNYRAGMSGEIEGFEDRYYEIRKPAECIIPNFRNTGKQDSDFVGGYVVVSGASRDRMNDAGIDPGVGTEFKEAIAKPGKWTAYMYMQGETIPKAANHVRLSSDRRDRWGIPQLVVNVGYDANDDRMVADFLGEGRKMMEAAGFRNIITYDNHQSPGLDIHEMGGARMGSAPETSVLNGHNQMHSCANVFVTDGACMTSTGNQSPSILYMALTARAVDYATSEMKAGRI